MRQEAVLRIGRRQLPARVLDESAGGFAVEVDQPCECRTGDVLLLRFSAGWMEVQVVDVVAPALDDAAKDAEPVNEPEPAGSTRLHVLRLRDIEQPEEETAPFSEWLRSLLVPRMPAGCPLLTGVLTVIGIGVVGLAVVMLLERSEPMSGVLHASADEASPQPESQILEPHQATRPRNLTARDESDESSPKRKPAGNPPKQDEATAPDPVPAAATDVAKEVAEEVRQRARQLAHPENLLRPEMSERLSLSEQQRRHLQNLAEEAQRDADLSGEEAASRHESLSRRAMALLSHEQHLTLAELHRRQQSEQGSVTDVAASEAPAIEPNPSDASEPASLR